MSEAAEKIADEYLSAAYTSTCARKKGDALRYRHQSYGLLKVLEILLGHMSDACRLIEERHETHSSRLGTNIDMLLYDFWVIPRPRQHV